MVEHYNNRCYRCLCGFEYFIYGQKKKAGQSGCGCDCNGCETSGCSTQKNTN